MPERTNFRATGTADAEAIYAQNGLFGLCGVDPVLVNAMVNPSGVDRILTWVGTNEENPVFDALAYMGSTSGAQSSDCASCGKPYFRECAQTAVFGRYCQQTQEMQTDEIGLRMNRGVPTMALYGNITDPAGNVLVSQGEQIRDVFALNVAGVAYNLKMLLGDQLWAGNPTNNTGGRREFKGFDLLINTGYSDAVTGLDCEMLDSYLIDYASNVVGDTDSPSIVAYVSAAVRSIRYRIESMGIPPDDSEMYIVMTPQLWEVVARAWACEYGLTCDVGATVRQDALEIANLRDNFMAQMMITIDGRDYPVITDNLITQTTSAYGNTTKFCSDIYIITTRVGSMQITYGQYQDFNMTAGSALAELRSMFGQGGVPTAITDGGRFIHVPTIEGGLCFDVRTVVKPRIIMRMPQLSGRVQNVCGVPLGTYPAPTGSGLYGELTGGSSTKPYVYLYP